MKRILCIDPGTTESGLVRLNLTEDGEYSVFSKGIVRNDEIIESFHRLNTNIVVVEMITSYGMPVGKSTFDTLILIGEIKGYCKASHIDFHLIARREVKQHLCGSTRAKDKNISQAIKDRFLPTGGGSDKYKGTKSKPGPLYGFKSHLFSALALGISFIEGCKIYKETIDEVSGK